MLLKNQQTNDTRISDIELPGWVEITEAERDAIFASRSVTLLPPTPEQRLRDLDTRYALSQRNLREVVMLFSTAFKQAGLDLTAIPGVQQVFAAEAEAIAIRAEINA